RTWRLRTTAAQPGFPSWERRASPVLLRPSTEPAERPAAPHESNAKRDASLVPQFFVHHILKRRSRAKASIVFNEEVHRLLQPSGRHIRAVRRKQHIIEIVECVPRGQWFLIEHIEGRPQNPIAPQCLHQRCFVHHRTTPNVDEYHRWLHNG